MNRRVLEATLIDARRRLGRALRELRADHYHTAARGVTDAIGKAEAARDCIALEAQRFEAGAQCGACLQAFPAGVLLVAAGTAWCPTCYAARCAGNGG